VKEEEFWRNFFYRVGLIQQQFELKDLEDDGREKKKQDTKSNKERKNILESESADAEMRLVVFSSSYSFLV
jgi:hypothetical protein